MPEQIDELFVKLGLEQDQEQFQQAQNSFDSLRSAALQFGAVIGAGFGLNELTFGFANTTNEARKLAEVFEGLDVTPQFVDALRGAFRLIDEDASEAASTIENIAQIIEDTDWGEISEQAFARGFDISGIEDAENMAEALAALNEQFRSMEDQERARRLAGALGLSDAQFRLMRQTDVGQQMSRAAELRPMEQDQVEAAEEFAHGWQELSLAMEGLQREISEAFVGDIGESMSEMADILAENKKAIEDFAEDAVPILGGMASSLGILVGLRTARAGLGIFSKVPLATLAAGGLAGFAYQQATTGERMSPEEQEQFNKEMGIDLGGTRTGMPPPGGQEEQEEQSLIPRSGTRRGAPEDMTFENRMWPLDLSSGQTTDVRNETNNIFNMDQRQFLPETSNTAPTENRTETNYNITIDARGSTDPRSIRENVKRGTEEALRESAETTIEDFATEVQ